jgi:hypothetical protein
VWPPSDSKPEDEQQQQQQHQHQHTPLTRVALQAVLSTAADCILVGMRRPAYVHNVMNNLTTKKFTLTELTELGQRAHAAVTKLVKPLESSEKTVPSPTSS